jgi:rod shape-determining protein MreD
VAGVKRKALIITILLHALLLMAIYIFQGMVFPYLRIAGLAPLLLPVVSTGIAIYEGRFAGGINGIFAGILCDISFNEPVGVFTVVLTFTGLLIGTLADTVIMRGFVTFFLSSAAVLVIAAVIQMFPLVFFEGVPPQQLMPTALWQTVYSLAFTFPIWFFVRALGKRAERESPSGRPL